jgi:O-antigen/teichoic acid export membrane protein
MWMTINSFVTLFGFASLGIGLSLMTRIAHDTGKGDVEAQRASISDALAISSGVVFVLGLLGAIVGPAIPWSRVLNVSSPLAVAEAGPSMAVFAVSFLLTLPLGIASSVWNGLQRTYVSGVFLALGPALGVAGVVACVWTNQGLPMLVAAAAGGPLLAAIMCAGLLLVTRPELRPAISLISGPGMRSLLGVGIGYFLMQVAVAVGTGADALVLAQVIGPAAVAEYAIVARLFNIPVQLGTSVVSTLWPGLSEARSRGDHAWVSGAMRRVVFVATAVAGPPVVVLLVGGQWITHLITQGSLEPGFGLYAAFAAATVAIVATSTASVFLNSAGVIWPQVICLGVMALVNIALGIALSARIGTAGVVVSTALTYGVTLIPLAWLAIRTDRDGATRSVG